jgi:hypothetical protein
MDVFVMRLWCSNVCTCTYYMYCLVIFHLYCVH